MPIQQRNDGMVQLLGADFQKRYEPNFSFAQAIGMFLLLPEMRGFWPMSSADDGYVYDISGQAGQLTNNSSSVYGYRDLAPYVGFDGSADYLSYDGGGGSSPVHVLATTSALGPSHTVSGLTARQFLVATDATTALFRAMEDADIPATIARDSELHDAVTLAASLDSNLLSLSTQELGLDTQAANIVFAGPTTGGAAVPSFRVLVDADIPAAIARDSEVTAAIAAHAAVANAHHDPVTAGNTAVSIAGQAVSVALAATSGLAISSGLMIADTVAGAGLTIASKVLAVGVSGLGLSTTADAVVLTSSAAGAADAHILATDAAGGTQVVKLTTNTIEANADLTLNPNNDVKVADGVNVYLSNSDFLYFYNAAGTSYAAYAQANASGDLLLVSAVAGRVVLFGPRNIADTAYLQAQFSDYGGGEIQLHLVGDSHITAGGSLEIEPAAGNSLLINLSTTGDLIVNTDDLVVDTSTGRVGIGTAAPGAKVEIAQAGEALRLTGGATGDSNTVYLTFYDSGGTRRGYLGDGSSGDDDITLGADTGNIILFSNGGNRVRVFSGMQVGTPTGGDKGVGTINTAADIYKNNSAYTSPDYALEMWRDGRIVQFANNPGAADYRRLSLMEIRSHIIDHLRLPGFTDQPAGIFERGDLVLEKLEEIFTFLIDHEERLEAIGG